MKQQHNKNSYAFFSFGFFHIPPSGITATNLQCPYLGFGLTSEATSHARHHAHKHDHTMLPSSASFGQPWWQLKPISGCPKKAG